MIKVTSVELAKKLMKVGFHRWTEVVWTRPYNSKEDYKLVYTNTITDKNLSTYPAYDILNDICMKHAEEFFGSREYTISQIVKIDDVLQKENEPVKIPEWLFKSIEILQLVQASTIKKVEKYIWDNCLQNDTERK